jgi:hypothetical protein
MMRVKLGAKKADFMQVFALLTHPKLEHRQWGALL